MALKPVARSLIAFVLPRRQPADPEEGLVFALDPATGNLVIQLALTAEHFREFTLERPCTLPVPPDAAVALAHELLRAFDPDVAAFLERAVAAAQLRLVQGGGETPEAA